MSEHDQVQLGITAAVTLIWLICVITCFLKWKMWTAIFGIIAPILSGIPIGGMYWHHIITEPFIYVGLPVAAIRLAKPVSWWAKWFYWGPVGSDRRLLHPSPKLARAFARFPEQRTDFETPESSSANPVMWNRVPDDDRRQGDVLVHERDKATEPGGLTSEEQQLLNKYLPFYRDLETGRRRPETEEQKHFIRVTLGQAVAETPHEIAYAKYMRTRR